MSISGKSKISLGISILLLINSSFFWLNSFINLFKFDNNKSVLSISFLSSIVFSSTSFISVTSFKTELSSE